MPKEVKKGLIRIEIGGISSVVEIDEVTQPIEEREAEQKELLRKRVEKTKEEKLVEKQEKLLKEKRGG